MVVGGAIRDARIGAVLRRAAACVLVAAAAAWSLRRGLPLLLVSGAVTWSTETVTLVTRCLMVTLQVAIVQSTSALATVAAVELLVAFGFRASLRARRLPLLLWVPRLAFVPSSEVNGMQEDVASKKDTKKDSKKKR